MSCTGSQTLHKAIDHRQRGPAFLSPKGEPWSVGNLSSTHKRLRDAAGLPRDLVLDLARHRFGSEALRAGVPLKDIAALWPVSGTAAKSGGPSHAARPQVS
jgi:hypothetical protein